MYTIFHSFHNVLFGLHEMFVQKHFYSPVGHTFEPNSLVVDQSIKG